MRERYQIFISSPYKGLEEARSAVIQGVLLLDWHPMAMEFSLAWDVGMLKQWLRFLLWSAHNK